MYNITQYIFKRLWIIRIVILYGIRIYSTQREGSGETDRPEALSFLPLNLTHNFCTIKIKNKNLTCALNSCFSFSHLCIVSYLYVPIIYQIVIVLVITMSNLSSSLIVMRIKEVDIRKKAYIQRTKNTPAIIFF